MRPLATASRRGFTLVELLVVIAIIGTLMGLLLPAVQSARESGRRNTCANNMRNLGFATKRYEMAKGAYPGWRNQNISSILPSSTNPMTQPPLYSWPVMLLPDLERSDIYDAAQARPTPDFGVIVPQSEGVLSIYTCASSPPSQPTQPSMSFVGNCGQYDARASGATVLQMKSSGVFLDRAGSSPVSLSEDQVTTGDGTSNTLMFSERAGANVATTPFWSARQPNSGSPEPDVSLIAVASGTTYTGTPAFVLPGPSVAMAKVINATQATYTMPNSATVNPADAFPSSNHPGGVNVVFCDNHLMFLRDTIAPNILTQLMTPKNDLASPTWRSSVILNEKDYK